MAVAALTEGVKVLHDDQSVASHLLAMLESRQAFLDAYARADDEFRREQAAELWDMEIEMRRFVTVRRTQIALLLLTH